MAQRLRGEETEVIIIANGQVQSTLTDIKSSEFTAMLDLLRENYLGETTERKDEIFKGSSGRMELHLETQDYFTFLNTIIDRAQRRTPGIQINIKTTFRFPNGDRPRVLFKDVFFGSQPMNIASRSDYVAVTMEFESPNRGQVIA